MAQWIKCLTQKYTDLSSKPENSHNQQVGVVPSLALGTHTKVSVFDGKWFLLVVARLAFFL